MMVDTTRIEKLASDILLHKRRYYAGNSTVPDAVYDALEDELRRLDPGHPVLSIVGSDLVAEGGKVAHEPPMLSLEKSYEVDDIFKFTEKQKVICTDKFDGMALSLEYDGRGQLFRASTRGSGTQGENVTEYVLHIARIPKRIPVAPEFAGLQVEVRGEVYFPLSAFEQFAHEFDSYRNAVPGTFGRKEIEAAVPVLRELGFCAYDFLVRRESNGGVVSCRALIDSGALSGSSFFERLRLMERWGFLTGCGEGYAEPVSATDAEALSQFLAERFARARDHQIDGLVFRLDDDLLWESLGATAHHPRGSIAFKQTGEVAVTRILAIETAMGRSGKMTFRARLEPVLLSGAKISYATLHNAEFIEAGGYAPGALVKIKRSGEVIPAIIGLHEASSESYTLPELCPCGYPLLRRGPDLLCREQRPCAYKDQESLVHFVQTLDIMGLSDKTVTKLREAGLVREPSDIFRLQKSDLMQLEGFGEKSVDNLLAAIAARRRMPLAVFLTALGISRGGAVKCREVAKRFGTLDAVLAADAASLMEMRGWAEKSAQEFVVSLRDKGPSIQNLLQEVEVESETAAAAESVEGPLSGKNICITGTLSRPRSEYEAMIAAAGGQFVDSVSQRTHYLVCNEPSNSSKYKKAQALAIPILTEADLLALVGRS
jgi:DNA ligase (NAD+)